MLREHGGPVVLLVVSALLVLLSSAFPGRVYAPVGETYSLSPLPSRIQETYTPGVSLVLSVGNATTSQTYSFTWTVTDPVGVVTAASNSTSTSPTQTSFNISVIFPRSFPGANTQRAGNYSVLVNEVKPTNKLNVATGKFEVGLTDSRVYQRTAPVTIRATGYQAGESVLISLFNATGPVSYFSTVQSADFTGNVTYVWLSGPSTYVGINTLVVQGAGPRKTYQDSQVFMVFLTNLTISQLSVTPNPVQRTQTVEFRFNASYPYGMLAQSGSGPLIVTEPDGVTVHSVSVGYNSTLGQFVAYYRPLLGSSTGAWVGRIDVNSLDDGYGNRGPAANVVRGFTVQPALLTVAVSVANNVYGLGDLVPIYATVSSPDGSSFTGGSVTAIMTISGSQIGSAVPLVYDSSQGKWVGTYTVGSNSPSGVWFAQVQASDLYGNAGNGSTSVVISGGSLSFVSSYWFLALAAVLVGGAVVAFLFWRRKKIVRAVLKVDLQAISREARKVESRDFFRNIQDQLKKKEGTGGGE